jgi:transposase, IS5 family
LGSTPLIFQLLIKLTSNIIVVGDYRGHDVIGHWVLRRRVLTPALAKLLRRRSAIEPEIDHIKTDGRLARCALKGPSGDAVFAILCGCGHNVRKIFAHLRVVLRAVIAMILAILAPILDRKINRAAA